MFTKIFVVVSVTAVAVILAATINAPAPIIVAICGGAVVGVSLNLLPAGKPRTDARALIALAIAVSFVMGIVQLIFGLSSILQIVLGLVIGTPLGYFFNQE